jgi:hypothetical protein
MNCHNGVPLSDAWSKGAGLSGTSRGITVLRAVLTARELRTSLHLLRALPDPADAGIKVARRERISGFLHESAQVA